MNCSMMVKVKEEHQNPSQAARMEETTITTTSVRSIEPKWNEFQMENISESTFTYEDKLEHKLMPQYDLERNEGCFMDVPDYVSITNVDGLKKDISAQQMEVLVKSENCNIVNGIENKLKFFFGEWQMLHEEIDLKEEGPNTDELDNSFGGTNQQEGNNDKKFKCDVCDYQSNKKDHFTKHLLRHKSLDEVDTFNCNQCDFKTKYQCSLKKHIILHTSPEENEVFKCDQCHYQTHIKGALKNHFLRHQSLEDVDNFYCNQCDFITKYKGSMRQHLKTHEIPKDDAWLKCELCQYRARTKTAVRRHAFRHKSLDEADTFGCHHCTYKTINKDDFKKHLRCHENPQKVIFRCGQCDFKTVYKHNLKRHASFVKH